MTNSSPVMDKMLDLGRRLYPTSVFFELTHRCNGNCAYCYIQDKQTAADLDTCSAFKVLDKLSEAGVMHVVFTGGEIFIRHDILDILRHAIEKDFWYLGLMTNGTMLTKAHMDFIVHNKDRFGNGLSVSAFSHIPQVNDSYFCIPGALETLLANGEYLLRKGLNVDVKLTVMEFNIDSFMTTKEFFVKRGFSVSHFVGALFSPDWGKEGLKGSTEKDFVKKYLLQLPASEISARKKELEDRIAAPDAVGFCRGRYTSICIDNRGNVKPCVGFVVSDSCNILVDGTLRELLAQSNSMVEVREISKADLATCRECRFSGFCMPCLAEMNAEHGCLSYPSTRACSITKALYEL
jgi:radical SAM protein with 4Fe4S-binding SPASM domain